jgi:hypothetical protein
MLMRFQRFQSQRLGLLLLGCMLNVFLLSACQTNSEPPLEISSLTALTPPMEITALEPGGYPVELYWIEGEDGRGFEARHPDGGVPSDPLRIVISYNVVPLGSSTQITGEEQQRIEASQEQLSTQPEVTNTWEVDRTQLEAMEDTTGETVLMTSVLSPQTAPQYVIVYQMTTNMTRSFDAITLSARGKIVVSGDVAYQMD